MPLLPMAPERIRRGVPREPFDAPEQVLRRLVLLQFPPGIDTTARRQQLFATGLFNRVDERPRVPQLITFAQANSEPLGAFNNDPHRWQWALTAINAPGQGGAWHYTLGRAQVASLDGGIVPAHPDVQAGPLSNLREHQSARARFDGAPGPQPRLFLSELGINPVNYEFLHHGIHVNTLMAAPINGAGIAGVCPQCTLQTFRTDRVLDVKPLTTLLAARFGSTALNHSFEPVSFSINDYPFAIEAVMARDVVMVASAGNSAVEIFSWSNPDRVPHRYPQVLKIGATDPENHLWSEMRILTALPPPPQHPVRALANVNCANPADPVTCVRARITQRCTQGGDFAQCGSNFGFFDNIIDLVAPGVQVVGGLVEGAPPAQGIYRPVPPEAVYNAEAFPPSETGLGVSAAGVAIRDPAVVAHGPQTGTSMAAPHVTATAGLMRSINPLLSAQAVRLGLTERAKRDGLPVPHNPRRMGRGLLDARHAVEDAAGQVRGARLRNRLVPMFAMYAAESQIQSESAEGEFFGSMSIHSWLFTTNPQLASAAIKGDIYYSGVFGASVIPAQAQFGPTVTAAYVHGHLVTLPGPLGLPIPEHVYQLPEGAGNGKPARTPAASFYVYTTPHSPLPGFNLQPLYRLSTDMTVESGQALTCAGDQRKHLYSTDVSEVVARTLAAYNCNLAPMLMRYHFESIEGYVYDRARLDRPPGTHALFRVFSTQPGQNVAALVVEGESLPGYTLPGSAVSTNSNFLGWVYRTFQPAQSGSGLEPADRDQDGLPDEVEIALGLNEQAANGDCQGANDAIEYGFANLPDDPMSPTQGCADGRVSVVRPNPNATGEARVIFSNPQGPMTVPVGDVVRVTFYQGGGWPISIPVGCKFDDTDIGLAYKHYLCGLAAPLAPAAHAAVEFVFQVEARTNPTAMHQAVVVIPSGFTDPGLPTNNTRLF